MQEIFAWNPKSWALESETQLDESGTQVLMTKVRNPGPGIRNLRRRIQNPRVS